MKPLSRRLLPTLLALAVAPAAAADLFVIAHRDVQLSREEVAEVYRGERQFAGDVLLRPADNAAFRPEFVNRALGMDEVRYESHWTRKAFREGLIAPQLQGGDAEVAAFVARTPGAIGYVREAPDNVRILTRY
ncbi:MAG: phosphate ABC transporter substrate-binding protein [Rhodocyclaceae bacterium]|nr:phosphate ABC transporter substrate-binding protein [Rhodocyclaceae bacterium]